MNTILLVNSKKDKKIFYLVDIIDKSYKIINRNLEGQHNLGDFDTISYKYANDVVNLNESSGTLAYINKEYGFYGILRERSGGVGIVWISKEIADNDPKYDTMSNIHNELLDITSDGLTVLNKKWNKKLKVGMKVNSLSGLVINPDDFFKSIGVQLEQEQEQSDNEVGDESSENTPEISQFEHFEVVNEPTETGDIYFKDEDDTNTPEDAEPTIEDRDTKDNENKQLKNISILFNSYMKDIEQRMIAISTKEAELAKKEAELIEASNRIDSILSKADMYHVDSMLDTLIGVDVIVDNGVLNIDETAESEYVYELILKILKKNDSITIPFTYYTKLKPSVKKLLEHNKAFTEIKYLSEIRLSNSYKYNLVAVVTCNETLNTANIHILKPYNTDVMNDNQLKEFLIEYATWRKKTQTY